VYNNKGQLIRKLVSATKDSGLYRVGWDGKDNNGRSVSGGIYFVRMTADHNQYIQKVTLLK
jgi:flagellar hook assembly protein FlgD